MVAYTVRIPMDLNDNIEIQQRDDDWTPELEDIRDGIGGGYIERVTSKQIDCWVDEEGIPKGMGYNVRASKLMGRTLLGDAFVTGNDDPDGRGLTHNELWRVCSVLSIPVPKEPSDA